MIACIHRSKQFMRFKSSSAFKNRGSKKCVVTLKNQKWTRMKIKHVLYLGTEWRVWQWRLNWSNFITNESTRQSPPNVDSRIPWNRCVFLVLCFCLALFLFVWKLSIPKLPFFSSALDPDTFHSFVIGVYKRNVCY